MCAFVDLVTFEFKFKFPRESCAIEAIWEFWNSASLPGDVMWKVTGRPVPTPTTGSCLITGKSSMLFPLF